MGERKTRPLGTIWTGNTTYGWEAQMWTGSGHLQTKAERFSINVTYINLLLLFIYTFIYWHYAAMALLLPVIPWLFILPILYSALSEGSRAAPIVIPSSMALNFSTIGFFSSPSGSCGYSLASTGVWLILEALSAGCGVGVSSLFGGGLT